MAISRSQLKRSLTGLGYGGAQREIFRELGGKGLTSRNIGKAVKKLAKEGKISRSAGAAFKRRSTLAEKKFTETKPEVPERKASLLGTLFGARRKSQVSSGSKKEFTPKEERAEYLKKTYREVEERRRAEEEEKGREKKLEKELPEQFR